MNYSGMPMGMWYLYEKSFRDKLVSVMGYDRETADGIAKKAKWKYKSIIEKLPEFEKEDRFKMKVAVVLKWWCRQNDIPYNDDMDNIEAAYRWYYKYEDEGDDYSPIYHLVMH